MDEPVETTETDDTDDPVLRRRAAIAMWCARGKQVGYSLYLLAVVLFFVGFAVDFSDALVDVIVGAMVVGAIVLIPAIVFAYGAKAAERDERGESIRY